MKLKDILAIIKQKKNIILFSHDDIQYISDGTAAYPMFGLPWLKMDNLQALLDCTESQWRSYSVQEKELPFDDTLDVDGDILLSNMHITIEHHGYTVVPFTGGGKLFYIQVQYLKPFFGEKNTSFTYYARSIGVRRYMIVVKEGFFVKGFIMPCDFADKELVDKLQSLMIMSNECLDDKQITEQARQMYSSLLFEEDDDEDIM